MRPAIVDDVVRKLRDELTTFILIPTPLTTPPGSATVGVRVGTWVALIDSVETACGIVRRQALLSGYEQAQLVAECLHAISPSFLDLAPLISPDPIPLAQSLLGTLNEARMHDVTSLASESLLAALGDCDDATRAFLAKRVDFIRELVERYERRLGQIGLEDHTLRLKRVVAALQDGWFSSPFDRLVICDESPRTPLQDKLLEGIERQGVNVVFWESSGEQEGERTLLEAFSKGRSSYEPSADDDSIRIVRARSAADELHAAAQLLLEEAASGIRFSDIAIVAPADECYLDRLTQVFDRYDIPHTVPVESAGFDDPLVQTFAAWLRVWAGSRESADIVSVLDDPGLRLGPIRTRLVRRFAEERPIFSHDIERLLDESLPERLEGFVQESVQALRKLLTAVELTEARLTLSAKSLSEAWSLFRETVLSARRGRAAARGDRFALQGTAAFDAAVELMLEGTNEDESLPIEVWLRRLGVLLQGGLDMPHVRRGVTVHVSDVTLDLGCPELLLVLGFTRGRYPGRPSTASVLGYFERATLQRSGLISLETPAERLRYEERQVRAWMGSARRLVCFVPERNVAGEPTAPSLLYETMTAMIPAHDRNAWLQRCDQRHLPAVYPRREYSPFACDFPREAGLLEAVRTVRHSPTGLREFLECPYKFAANRMLGLRDFGLASASDIDPMTQGEIVHGVVQRLFVGTSPGVDLDQQSLGQIVQSVVEERAPWILAPRLRTRYLGLQRRVQQFVPRLFDLLRKLDLEVVGCEVAFGEEEPATLRYGDIKLAFRGRMDIVARRNSDGLRVVLDIKFGKVEKYCTATLAGFDPQMAIYCRVHGAQAALYYSFIDDRQPLGAFTSDAFGWSEPPDHAQTEHASLSAIEEALARRLGETFGEIEQHGAILPVDLDRYEIEMKPARVSPCQYCNNALLCRQPVGV